MSDENKKPFGALLGFLRGTEEKIREKLEPRLGKERYKALAQFFKFCCVGVINTGVDLLVFTLVYDIVNVNNKFLRNGAAFTAGYCCGIISSYLLNKFWTFKDKRKSYPQAIKFVAVNVITYLFGMGIMKVLSLAGITGDLAKIISLPFTMLMNFIGNKLFVFRTKEGE